MELGAPNSEVVNMTRAREAVAPLLNNPRKTIHQVEVLVSVAAALLFLQFILGFCKRLWHNSIVSFVLKVCDKAMFPLIVYILGKMQNSPIKNSVYPVWAVSLIMASEATSAVKQPDLFTPEKMASFYIEMARYAFYYLMFSQLLNPSTPRFSWLPGYYQHYMSPNASSSFYTSALFECVILSKLFKGIVGLTFGFSHSESVAKWMKKNANSDDHSDSDPESMNDYNYPVRYSIGKLFKSHRAHLSIAEGLSNVTTVNQIWDSFQNSNDGICADHKNRLKDVCLSFALFELLKRRYFGTFCAEASLRKTKYFVSRVLLRHPDDDYERAFKVVETELGLCYDFLFTKYQFIYTTGLFLPIWIVMFVLFVVKIILIIVVGVYAHKKSLVLETPSPIIEVHSANADYIIALAFIYIILMMNISAGCRNRIGQCSLISDFSVPTCLNKLKIPTVRVSNELKRAIANAVKKAIDNSLISADGDLTMGERTIRMFDEYSQTLKDHSQIEVMLILHIATDYCDIALSDEGEGREVAINLSRYFAYLIAFVPELLPYHMVDISELRDIVWEEIETLPSRRSSKMCGTMKLLQTAIMAPYTPSKMFDIMKDLEGTGEEDNPTTIFTKGVKLGKQLASMSNGAQRWEMLAEFWAETIVYITPSHHTAKNHMEHLECGGEFLTKIWVLLSHAGILNIDREKDQAPKRAQPETA
ncbi:hypothetical protein EJB05_10659, partial [Eragrostis curvula]